LACDIDKKLKVNEFSFGHLTSLLSLHSLVNICAVSHADPSHSGSGISMSDTMLGLLSGGIVLFIVIATVIIIKRTLHRRRKRQAIRYGKLRLGLLLITNRKSYTGSRLAPNLMTLNDLKCQNKGFMDFLAILGCDTSLHHSQGGATELSLCDPDREFGICILT